MAPITCQALDKCKEPLVGLHVILECFEGTLMETAMRYTATTSLDGTVELWSPIADFDCFPESIESKEMPVPIDSSPYSTCRLTFFTGYMDDSTWPFIQVDVLLRPDHKHLVTMTLESASYHIQTVTHPEHGTLALPSPGLELEIPQDQASLADAALVPADAPPRGHVEQRLCMEPDPPQPTEHGGDHAAMRQPKKRGRPRKYPNGPPPTNKVPRKRGRPRKVTIVQDQQHRAVA